MHCFKVIFTSLNSVQLNCHWLIELWLIVAFINDIYLSGGTLNLGWESLDLAEGVFCWPIFWQQQAYLSLKSLIRGLHGPKPQPCLRQSHPLLLMHKWGKISSKNSVNVSTGKTTPLAGKLALDNFYNNSAIWYQIEQMMVWFLL